MTTPGPPGLVRPETDPLPDPVALEGGIGQVRRAVAYSAPAGFRRWSSTSTRPLTARHQ
jgi:hypothetical protein